MKEQDKSLPELIQDMVHENNAKELIWAFGFKMVNGERKPLKSLGQLYKEVSENGGGAKIGLYDFITLVKETGDFAPVYKMLDELGLIGMPKEASPDGKSYHHEINQAVVVFSELMREANKSAPSAMDMTMKLSKLHKEVSDIIVRVQQGETA